MFLLSVWWRWAEGGGQIVISLGHTDYQLQTQLVCSEWTQSPDRDKVDRSVVSEFVTNGTSRHFSAACAGWLAAPHRAKSANYDCVPIYQTHIGSLDTTGASSSAVNIAGTHFSRTPFMSFR